MAGLRAWATAIESTSSGHLVARATSTRSSAKLKTFAATHNLPIVDGWGTPFRVEATATSYLIQAAGSDGEFAPVVAGRVTQNFDDDIAFANGAFIQYPEGI